MTVRRSSYFVLTLALACFAAGCGRDENQPLPAETDEPLYVQAQQLKRQGRNPEALVGFLKVIEKRGEQFAEESHLEAGLIYLHHHKDYIAAIYHFKKYLALEPNSRQAPGVLELVNTAKREFARTLPARPAEELSPPPEVVAEIQQLRRENDELRAHIATLRGGGAMPVPRSRGARVTLPTPIMPNPLPAHAPDDSPLTFAPPAVTTEAGRPGANNPDPAPARGAPSTSSGRGRIHTVRPGDTLFALARQAEPTAASKKMNEIVEANRDVLPQGVNTPLKAGMELRIP